MEIFNKIVSIGDLCYDIGANNGIKTESLLNLGAKVVCVEPQLGCYEHLVSKFNNNQNIFK